MFRITVNKSTVVFSAGIVAFLFIAGVSGHPTEEDGSNVNNNTSANNSSSKFDEEAVVLSSNVTSSCLCGGGSDGVPCEKNVTSTDCPNGRVIARSDCSCCFVCAKQLTENCNDKDRPCDSDYGLMCGADLKCQGKYSRFT